MVFSVRPLVPVMLVFSCQWCLAPGVNAGILTPNLLVNPGAETGDLTGWTAGGAVSPMVASPATIPPAADIGFQPHSGDYFFVGGRNGSGFLIQQVSLLLAPALTSGLIDTGTLMADVSTWEMNFDQRFEVPVDNGQLTITFRNGSQQQLGQFMSPILENSQSNNATSSQYALFAASVPIPVGTRFIDFRKDFYFNSPPVSDNDTYFDDSSLSISAPTAVPEPGTLTLAGLGIVGLLGARWRKRRAGG